MKRTDLRMLWLLERIANTSLGYCTAWDEELVDDFVKEFPESEKTMKVYLMGPNSVPMLNQAAQRAKKMGLLKAGHCGTPDARSYNQRTWARTWTITPEGRDFAAPI